MNSLRMLEYPGFVGSLHPNGLGQSKIAPGNYPSTGFVGSKSYLGKPLLAILLAGRACCRCLGMILPTPMRLALPGRPQGPHFHSRNF